MTMRLSCSGCGGTVAADDAALRRSLAVCSRCNAILRVTPNGLAPEPTPAPSVEVPAGVEVDRRGARDLAISARRPRGAWALTRLTGLVAWTSGLAAAALCTPSLGFAGAALGLPIGVAAFVAAAKLQRRHRPLELRGGLLLPSDPEQPPVPVADLQQVYAAVCHLDLGGDSNFASSNVFALTHSGERVLLMGPVENEQVALAIERVLEVELQIFDLPVMGESARPELRAGGLDSSRLPRPDTQPSDCEGCGGPITPTAAEARRGLAECGQCRGLSLLFDIDAQMCALGAAMPRRSYEIDEDVDGLAIVALDSNPAGGSVEVTGERVVLRRLGIAPMTLAAADLSAITVREARSEAEFDLDLDHGLEKLRGATSLSGSVNLASLVLGGANAVSFRVTARHPSHNELEIACHLHDPREAFLIARTLKRVLSKCA